MLRGRTTSSILVPNISRSLKLDRHLPFVCVTNSLNCDIPPAQGLQEDNHGSKSVCLRITCIVWLGCSDSRVPETTLLGLQPGEVFVHRNIANIITTSDLNVLAVIEYAVVHLKVKHVVLCGHTSCGGAAAAMSDDKVGGVLDAWLTPLRVVRKREWKRELEHIKDDKERAVKLAELNVAEGIGHLMANNVIEDAIRDRGLKVHGCIYDIGSGLLRELGFGTEGPVQPNEHGVDELTSEELGIRNGVAGHESSKDVKSTKEKTVTTAAAHPTASSAPFTEETTFTPTTASKTEESVQTA